MTYDYDDIEFAMCAIRVLAVIAAVAVVSYATKSRAMFIAGCVGGLMGSLASQPRTYINGPAEAALEWTADQTLANCMLGACVACAVVAGFLAVRTTKTQYTLRAIFLTVTEFGVIFALIRFLLS